MVLFRVTENINIKTTDGTLVKYLKLRNPSQLIHNSLYITTYDDKCKLDKVFEKVGEEYQTKVLLESKIDKLKRFPKELGISNKYEYRNILTFEEGYFNEATPFSSQNRRFYLDESFSDIHEQLKECSKDEISLVILGNVGENIGEMIASLSALRILHEELCKKFKHVIIDIYIEASENSYFTRDRDILRMQPFINAIHPLSISVKKFCEYDFYIDNSSIKNRYFYEKLSFVDALLYKFGIDYKKISSSRKHNLLDLSTTVIRTDLQTKVEALKKRNKKLLLFHPYSSENSRSIPKEVASKFLKKLIKKDEYVVISAVNIEDIKDDNYINLTAYSKSVNDFIYIISNMDKIITVDTATYHIADAFFVPTIVLFTDVEASKRIENYQFTKAIQIEDESQNFSHFKFDNETLVLHKYASWKKIKIKEVIKLLETI